MKINEISHPKCQRLSTLKYPWEAKPSKTATVDKLVNYKLQDTDQHILKIFLTIPLTAQRQILKFNKNQFKIDEHQ